MNTRKAIFSLLLLIISLGSIPSLMAQAHLQGSVYNKHTGHPLRNVSVTILNTTWGDVTDKAGYFSIMELEEGVYRIELSKIGYQTTIKELLVRPTDTLLSVGMSMHLSVAKLHQQVLITAQRYERDPFLSPAAVNSYDRQEFQSKSPRTLSEALSGTPGVWLHQPFYGGGEARIRGMGANRTILMVDGIRMNHSAFGPGSHSLLSLVDPFGMDRVEVLRGGGSVQYGTDAIGGVIQVLTRTPRFADEGLQVHGSAYGRILSRNMEQGLRGEIEVSTPRLAISGGASLRAFGDISPGAKGETLAHTGYGEQAADVKARIKLSPRHLLTLSYQYMEQDSQSQWGLLDQGKFVQAGISSLERKLAYAKMTSYFSNKWLHKVSVTTAFHRIDEGSVRQRTSSQDVREDADQLHTWSSNLEIHSRPMAQWNIVSGVEYYRDEMWSEGSLTPTGSHVSTPVRGQLANESFATNLSLYSLHTLDILKLRLTLGGRARAYQLDMDDPMIGTQAIHPKALVGNISGLYPLHPNWNLVSSFNTGYRSPNASDYSRFGLIDQGFGLPSDSVGAERTLTSELGLKAKTPHFSGSLMVYQTKFRDRTDWVPSLYQGMETYEGLPVYEQVHVGQAYIRGIEAAIEVPVNRMFAVYGGLTYMQGRNVVNDEPLAQIPPLNGRLGLRMRSKVGIWSNLEWRYASLQDRLAPLDFAHPYITDAGSNGWNVVDLHVGYDFQWGYATIGFKNLLDESYRFHGSSIDAPGRLILLSLQLGF